MKHEVKWKMIEGINKEELVLLKFTTEEAQNALKWKHSREFEYQKEMYDIVETKVIGDTTYYWCWWDHEETQLNKQLSLLVAKALNSNPEKKEKEDWLSSYFKSFYLQKAFSWKAEEKAKSLESNSIYLLMKYSIHYPPPVQPPELT